MQIQTAKAKDADPHCQNKCEAGLYCYNTDRADPNGLKNWGEWRC